MKIECKTIRHGYARIDKNGELLITIPLSKKNDQNFIDELIKKGEQLLKRYNKRTHITPLQKDTILLFGEEIPSKEFYKTYNKKQLSTSNLSPSTKKLLKVILEEYATPILQSYSQKIGIEYKKLTIRKTASKRWSCTHDQKISLNLDLIHLPTKYIKYVIIHECCHLKVKNHSKKFRSLVEYHCPDYQTTKRELRKFIIK